MHYHKYHIAFLFIILGFLNGFGQDWEDQSGEIEDAEVVIEKNVAITLPFANRIFNKIPPLPVTNQIPQLQYKFKEFKPDLSPLNTQIRALTVQDENLSKIYGNYIKAGFGNFTTPYFEGLFNNKRDQKYHYGLHVKHLSSSSGPVDSKNSGNGITSASLYGKVIRPNGFVSGGLNYKLNTFNFYGYPEGIAVEKDTIEQKINRFGVVLGFGDFNKQHDFNYEFKLSYQNMTDDLDAKEGAFKLDAKTSFQAFKTSRFLVDGDLSFITREDAGIASFTRHLIRVNPAYEFTYNGLLIKVGVWAALENDDIVNLDKFHLYPDVKVQYNTGSSAIYGGITGGINSRSLNYFLIDNPFLIQNVAVYHENKEIEIYGGLKSSIATKLNLELGASFASFENMGFYSNDPALINKFTILYDTAGVDQFQLFAEVGFQSNEAVKLNIRGDYFSFSTKSLQEAWHKPEYRLSFSGLYNLYGKLLLSTEALLMGGIKAQGFSGTVNLDPAIDLSLKLDYIVSPRFSVFMQGLNLISEEYELLNRYPVRGLQVIGGVSYSF